MATVSSLGLVTGVGVGTATITVTTVDGGYTANCTVTVTRYDSTKYYKITYYSGSTLAMDTTTTGLNGVVKNVTYAGANSQQWQIIATTDASTFKVVNRATGYALKVNSTTNTTGKQIIQSTYASANNMNFTISDAGSYVQILSKLGSNTYIKSTGATGGTLVTSATNTTTTRWVITLLPWTYQGVVNGIADGEAYDLAKGDLNVTFSEGSATLNGTDYTSGSIINQIGNYTLILTDSIGNEKEISFIVMDTSYPIVTGVSNGGVYDSKYGAKVISFDKGNATLNGIPFLSGSSISATGNYKLIVALNNVTTIDFTYIKYGDVTGDGLINVYDLVYIKRHLLKINTLSGVFLLAGNINNDNNISISDLLAIKKYILGIGVI